MSPNGRLITVALTLLIAFGLILTSCAAPAATPTPVPPAATPTKAPAAEPTKATVAPTATPVPAAAKPVKITIAIGGDPTTLDPQAADDGNERAVNDNVYETLLTRDKDMKLIPHLAEDYKATSPTTWQFKLRSGVKFHNGEPFDAAAAAFSVNRIMDPKLNSEQRSFFETIKEAKATDANTVEIVTTGPDPILPARMYWLKMVPPKYAKENEADFVNKPIGTGPYKFVEWVRGTRVVLTINKDYWGPKPQVADVVILPRKEATVRLSALKAGEVDLVRDLLPEQVDQAPKVVYTPGLEFPIIRINTKAEKLKDPRIRQAMNYAVDKQALIKNLYGGYAVLAEGQVLGPVHFGFNPNVKAYPYDLEKAKALLKEAKAEGLEVDLIGESGRWLKDKEVIEAVAGMLEKAGFKVKLSIQEWKRYLDLLFATDNPPDLIFVSHDNTLLDADRTLSAYYLSTGRVSSYLNPQVDKLINDARTEMDVKKREQMYHEAVKISRDDAAHIYLVNVDNIYGLSKRLEWKPPLDGRILVRDMKVTD